MIKKVFFVGRFRLPDGTAAAQLIKGIGKILRETGYQTVFIDKEVSAKVKTKEIVRVEERIIQSIKFYILIRGLVNLKVIRKKNRCWDYWTEKRMTYAWHIITIRLSEFLNSKDMRQVKRLH